MKTSKKHIAKSLFKFLIVTGYLLLAARPFAAEAIKPVKVFIFAGQSNMEGADARPERIDDFPTFKGAGVPQTNVLYAYLAGKDQDAFKGWGPLQPLRSFGSELTFARMLQKRDDAPIAIIKSAVGGTTVASLQAMAQSEQQVFVIPTASLPHARLHFGTQGTLLLGEEMAEAYLKTAR